MVLLDRKPAEEKYKLEVVKQDESYTYLAVTPKQVKRQGWLPDNFERRGSNADGNAASATVPKDMPRRLWCLSPFGDECTYDIKAWKLNAADAPKLEMFARPEDRPGWKVPGQTSGDKESELAGQQYASLG